MSVYQIDKDKCGLKVSKNGEAGNILEPMEGLKFKGHTANFLVLIHMTPSH